jgi:hypothetical protein
VMLQETGSWPRCCSLQKIGSEAWRGVAREEGAGLREGARQRRGRRGERSASGTLVIDHAGVGVRR